MIYKCKMCGGNIEFNPGDSSGICDSCGTRQTLPRFDDEKNSAMYERANQLRRNNEFDKAEALFEQLISNGCSDADVFWSLVLCRCGVEYVEDHTSHKRVPTVNRTQYTSIFDDADYQSALKYADEIQKEIYKTQAAQINEIMKKILTISNREEPFDIFICYKENDSYGRRTPDSVLAQDMYNQLVNEGFKVFFSRITLEEKLGSEYEPYIFAALRSSKIMIVLGTKPEYFNSVWVKNEWSRYLGFIKNGEKKTLIPAYRDMDAYELPEEFSHLQAQDMSKLGFMQDLIRGIKKITDKNDSAYKKETTVVYNSSNSNISNLLKRCSIFLEDQEWHSADDYAEKALDIDPENAEAYLYKLMIQLHVSKKDLLKNQTKPFDDSNYYKKVIKYGDNELKAEMSEYISAIKERNESIQIVKTKNNKKNTFIFGILAVSAVSLLIVFGIANIFKNDKPALSPDLKVNDTSKVSKNFTDQSDFSYNSDYSVASDKITSVNKKDPEDIQPKYFDCEYGRVLVINKSYGVGPSYYPANMITVPGGEQLVEDVYSAFSDMQNAAAAEGLNLYIPSGYISYETQNRLYANYCAQDGKENADTYSARPGHSEHHSGLCFDLNSIDDSFAYTAEGKWVAENCHKYGFIIRYPKSKEAQTGYKYEPWHLRYLGIDFATYLYEKDLCLEEYLGIASAYCEEE